MDGLYQFYFGYHEVVASWVLPAALAAASLIGGWLGQRKQAKENRKLAEFQAQANEQYLQQQLQYNDPSAQMSRYQQAGLNPHLIYGQGSSGNQSAPLQYPEIGKVDYQSQFQALAPLINQSMMTQSQTQAIDAKTRQTGVMTELNRLQVRVLERNPSLNPEAYNAIIDSLKSAAEIKASDATILGQRADWMTQKDFRVVKGGGKLADETVVTNLSRGWEKMDKELELLSQRFQLGQADQKIKAEVLQSKEFSNAILEVQKRWMTDAEVTPQHILQFIQLLLLKML